MKPENPKFSIIACDVFERELNAYLPSSKTTPVSVDFFEMGLHILPDEMRARLQKLIDNVGSQKKPEYILLLCGLCGNAVLGLNAANSKLVIPRVHDCISIFLGGANRYWELKKNHPRAYFASSGWMKSDLLPSQKLYNKIKFQYEEKFPDDPELLSDLMEAFTSQFKEYDTYLYAEFLPCLECECECKKYAQYLGWNFQKINSDDSFFKDAISANWDERFLIVPLGLKIKQSIGENILDA